VTTENVYFYINARYEMSNLPAQRPYKYEVSIPSDWAAFLMYLCVNAEKAWERGLAGSSIAEQICKTLRLPYSKPQVVASLDGIKFSRITLVVDYREINELTKFSHWCKEEISPTVFCFLGDDNTVSCLNSDSLNKMKKCLWKWRENFSGYGDLVSKDCGEIFIVADPDNKGLIT